ncbi:hypothetical protein [Deinococcus kurensis]|uniref:hypothetical protein n=1 Tax=Deinococcus kurensis TaxID=2662757 RepID=UPI0012D30257|nr:hypothetical protein [Deinococcus kurensis]
MNADTRQDILTLWQMHAPQAADLAYHYSSGTVYRFPELAQALTWTDAPEDADALVADEASRAALIGGASIVVASNLGGGVVLVTDPARRLRHEAQVTPEGVTVDGDETS